MAAPRRLLVLVCAVLAVAASGFSAAPALAAGNAIINDCQSHGALTHPDTVAELRHALAVMPATVKQYTNCYDVIQAAIISARKHNGTLPVSSGGGSSFLPTPVIIIIVVLILAALTYGALAIRRRRGDDGGPGSGGAPGGSPAAP
jgi:hypothetical protein